MTTTSDMSGGRGRTRRPGSAARRAAGRRRPRHGPPVRSGCLDGQVRGRSRPPAAAPPRGGWPVWPPNSPGSASAPRRWRPPSGTAGSPTPAWTDNPLLRRDRAGLPRGGAGSRSACRRRGAGVAGRQAGPFAHENLVEALSPSNVPLVNPASAKAAIDTGGDEPRPRRDQPAPRPGRPPRVPEMVDTSAFERGPQYRGHARGGSTAHGGQFELIQYRPQTEQVREVPLLVVPPTINKYYALDLAPGRSLVEYLVQNGQQVFVISWRNPDARHAAWGLDTYVQAVLDALDAAAAGMWRRPGRADRDLRRRHHRQHYAPPTWPPSASRSRLAAFGLLVTVLDTAQAGTVGALADRRLASAAKAMSSRRGYLDGRALAEVFAWLRPGDLVWNYWVNNYLLGKKPPAFDILFWNADTTRMTARLHADFVDLAMDNKLVSPGSADGARHGRGPVAGRHGRLHRRGHRRPHHPLAELLPQHPTARRREPVHPVHQRPHRRARQPARQPESLATRPARPTRPRRPTG